MASAALPAGQPGPAARGERYTRVAMWLHWITAAAVVANLAIGLLHEPYPALRKLLPAHEAIGLSVLALTLARIGWRLAHPAPPAPRDIPRWQQAASRATHFALYALLLAMPLSGWALASGAERYPLTWFGLFDVPYLPIPPAAADRADAAHGVLGWLMLGLVALHVAAALRHRLVLRDGVLARMAPALEPGG